MSKLTYHTAELSLCTDVKSARGRSIPFASFVLGETDDGEGFGALSLYVPRVDSAALRAVCNDLPVVLPLMILETLNAGGTATMKDIMSLIEDSFRNSVHVSKVRYDLTRDVEANVGLVAERIAATMLRPMLPKPVPAATPAKVRSRSKAREARQAARAKGVRVKTQSKWWTIPARLMLEQHAAI